ncbi:MAG: signal peptidase I [Rhodothalassiaceae bacterium]
MKRQIIGFAKDAAVIFGGFLLFSTFAYASYHIPSESMMPTLEVGDRLLVNKYTYGYSRYSVPLHPPLFEGRILAGGPKRGDVVVFHERGDAGGSLGFFGSLINALNFSDGVTYIKRVIGLPGDTIEMTGGRLYLNGKLVDRRPVRQLQARHRFGMVSVLTEYEEVLPGGISHRIYERSDNAPFDDTRLFTVPEGHYFMMGDNRDNSTDSRSPSGFIFVPADNIIGRADLISYSIARCSEAKGIKCVLGIPFERFFTRVG